MTFTVDDVWVATLNDILGNGLATTPRGLACVEVLHRTVNINMRYPVLTNKARSLSYRFMAAEAFWIMTGDNRVETIKPYNSRIAEFSDDGEVFFGAYGPKVVDQLPYVIDKLVEDPDTRQAGLNIWRENPPKTKDVPCTVSIFFSSKNSTVKKPDGRRTRTLHCHVFMRSSDAWLGFPYDVFNFSMLGHLVCAFINSRHNVDLPDYEPGMLYLTMVNSHLYSHNVSAAKDSVASFNSTFTSPVPTPALMFNDVDMLLYTLKCIRDGDKACRWWESTP